MLEYLVLVVPHDRTSVVSTTHGRPQPVVEHGGPGRQQVVRRRLVQLGAQVDRLNRYQEPAGQVLLHEPELEVREVRGSEGLRVDTEPSHSNDLADA